MGKMIVDLETALKEGVGMLLGIKDDEKWMGIS